MEIDMYLHISVTKFAEWMEWLIAAATLKGIKPIFKNGLRWKG